MERKKASDYPQELLNLFDRYVHGELDRPTFWRARRNSRWAVAPMRGKSVPGICCATSLRGCPAG
jgi:carboxymethylenebutenolidase